MDRLDVRSPVILHGPSMGGPETTASGLFRGKGAAQKIHSDPGVKFRFRGWWGSAVGFLGLCIRRTSIQEMFLFHQNVFSNLH